jgi:chromosome segregation ATPase
VDSTVTSTVKKSSQEKNNNETNTDINGRIEYIDQSVRSVDKRLQAVEKRLSVKTFELPHDDIITYSQTQGSVDEVLLSEIKDKLQEIDRKLATLEKTTQETHLNDFGSLKSQLSSIENRILKLENVNKITIGKIKVPIEFSGLAAAIVMFVTGFLIYSDHWSIIRSSYYPIAIGLLFCVVVLLKFIMTNRK